VHLIRYSMGFASWKERKAVASALKAAYRAESAEAAQAALEGFDQGPWGRKYPSIVSSWRRNWEQVIPFLTYPPEVRRIMYTTNAIESLRDWKMPPITWHAAKTQLAVMLGERFEVNR
jgi:putative transposase